MENLQHSIVWLNSVLSDYVLTVLLIGCGVFFSIRTRFVQFRCFGEGIRNALGKIEGVRQQSGISPFQSLMAAVAAQVGTGNIVGASGAIPAAFCICTEGGTMATATRFRMRLLPPLDTITVAMVAFLLIL